MKAKIISITIAMLSLSSATFANAYNYPSNTYDEVSEPASEGMQWKIGKDVSVSVNIPGMNERRPARRRPHLRMTWVNVFPGQPMPIDAVIGGSEPNNPDLFVCRASYNGGLHPGKVVGSQCNISWGGREIPMDRYQVLVSSYPLNWTRASYGSIPGDAIPGGFENGKTLYICQANYGGGTHPGKVVSQNCNIAWGGKEISLPNYNVLVG